MTTSDSRPEAGPRPIEGGTLFEGQDQTKLFQLIAAKHALGLEARGLRMSRLGPNGLRKAWAKHFGLPPKTPHLVIIQRIQRDIEDLSAKINFDSKQQELPL